MRKGRTLLLALLCAGGVAGALFGMEPLRFDGTQWRSLRLKQPGSEKVKVETAPLGDAGRTVPVVTWGTPHPGSIELYLQSKMRAFESFDRAELVLSVHAFEAIPLRRIVLRLADSSGEIFQALPDQAGGLAPGKTNCTTRSIRLLRKGAPGGETATIKSTGRSGWPESQST